SPLPDTLAGRSRTRATAVLRRPVPHHHPCLSAGLGSGTTRCICWGRGSAASFTVLSPGLRLLSKLVIGSGPLVPPRIHRAPLRAGPALGGLGVLLCRASDLQFDRVHARVGVLGAAVDL